jgi:hypothetical protein
MLIYVDPGSGSYLVQLLIAAVLGLGFYFRSGWNYIRSFFSRKKDEKN